MISIGYTDDSDDEATVYIDGKAVTPTTDTDASDAPAADSNPLLIGGPTTANFNGFIDEFKIYPYERSADQIKTDFGKVPSFHGKSASIGDDRSFVNNGLIGYWPLDDGVNNPCVYGVDKARDSSGNNFTGTWKNGAASTSGKFANAINFDGNNDYIRVTHDPALDPTDELTYAAWINKNTTTGDHRIMQKDDANVSPYYYKALMQHWTNFRFTYGVACVFDNSISQLIIYTDGEMLSSLTLNMGTSNNNTQDISIGNSGSSYTQYDFQGAIDNFSIYNYARTPAQIAWDYNRGAPIGWWKLDECQGTAAHDSSDNHLDGTIIPGASGNTSAGACNSGSSSEMWNNGTTGKYNRSLGFDGIDDYIDIGNQSSLFTPDQLTVSAWVKLGTIAPMQYGYYIFGDYNTAHNLSSFNPNYGYNSDNKFYFFWENPVATALTPKDIYGLQKQLADNSLSSYEKDKILKQL